MKTSEGEAAATRKGSNEEEREDLGNNGVLMTIMSTLDHMSRKFDLYEGRFETIDLWFDFYKARNMPNMD